MSKGEFTADDIAERVFRKLSASRRGPFAPPKDEDKAGIGLWNAYLDAVEDKDKASAESWKGSTTGILTFTGLFAATVAAFVIESYKMLQPDPGTEAAAIGNQAVALLVQLVQIASTNGTAAIVAVPGSRPEPFIAPETAVTINTLWFLSLAITLVCALLATLIQEWARDFSRDIHRRTPDMTLKEFAFQHIYVRMGVEAFKLDYVTSVIVALMHIAVILFLVGLSMFLHLIHHTPAIVVEIAGIIAASIYVTFSIMPFWDNSCPYRTPLTYVIVALGWMFITALCLVLSALLYPVLITRVTFKTVLKGRQGSDLSILIDLPNTLFLGVVRFYMYAWLPTRRLPGHRELPLHTPKTHDVFKLYDKDREQRRFINDSRLIFIWQYTSEYLLGSKGDLALFEYLSHQLFESHSRNYGSFLIPLRHNELFMNRLAKSMDSIKSLHAGLGALKLLQMFISAHHHLEARIHPVSRIHPDGLGLGRRWHAMKSFPGVIPSIVQRILDASKGVDFYDALETFVTLSELRWTLIHKRSQLMKKHKKNRFPFLDRMLLALENIDGFGMLTLYADTRRLSDHDFNQSGDKISWHYELAVRNVLSLLMNIMHLTKDKVPDRIVKTRLGTVIKAWRSLGTEEDFKSFLADSRGRRPSNHLWPVFFDHAPYYRRIMEKFSPLFYLPERAKIKASDLGTAYQALRDCGVLFQPDSQTSPQGPVSGSIGGDHATIGSAPELHNALPLIPGGSEERWPVSNNLALVVGEEMPDSPILRAAEEGRYHLA